MIRNFLSQEMGSFPKCHDGEGELGFIELFGEKDFSSGIRFFHHTVLPPKTSIGIHTHGNDEEIYIVLEGSGVMHLDGKDYEVAKGDVIINQPFGTHGIKNTGDQDLKLLVFEVVIDS
ncbi:putative cupin superfamily protein [Aequitasia blattaphilus]|uniref:Cupin domain-containing protein n=1 Tax=Aequitasia blattaphilus TaxID=2949332 RepID=A0ABT1EB20_9FIRM|nr:cupin domain-containing protein [Aequitasia blattaphilus]MCP1103008.1 cupin domain-containing protein [Aequitasia blattaphilus]MCR8615648.1 cupin domain-containing protein [Aequitasia blattaphilus]